MKNIYIHNNYYEQFEQREKLCNEEGREGEREREP
jgi:hypothetical protein